MNKPIIQVEWVDSSSYSGHPWAAEDRLIQSANEGLAKCVSVGYLIHETDEVLVIAMGYDTGGAILESFFIPKAVIKKITRLRKGVNK